MVKEVIANLDSSKASDPDYGGCSKEVGSSGGSKELWAWSLIHTSWALQYVSERVLFSRLLEGLIGGLCI